MRLVAHLVRCAAEALARKVIPYEYGQGFHDGYEAALDDIGLHDVLKAPTKEDVTWPASA